jgi:Domain of unknown function (DUF4270)
MWPHQTIKFVKYSANLAFSGQNVSNPNSYLYLLPIFFSMFFRTFCFVSLILFAIASSCNKSSTFGSDLLDDQTLNSIFTDTVQINMRLLPEDSFNTSDPNSIADYLLCGKLDDPILGTSSATIYSGLQLTALNNNFKGTKLDSVVLYLGVAPRSFYGDTTKLHTFDVTLLNNHPSKSTRYFSDTSIQTSTDAGALIGSGQWQPTPNIGRSLIDTTSINRDSVFGTWFSMRLSDAFGQKILAMDSATLNNDTLFWAQIKGIQIKSRDAGAVFGFNLNNRSFSRITLYYRADSLNAPQRVSNVQFIGENKFTQLQNTPSNYITSRLGKVITDDMIPLQGLAGTRVEVEVPHINDINKKDWAVNMADVIFYVATSVSGDNLSQYKPAQQLTTSISVGDTAYTAVADVAYSFAVTGNTYSLFGGSPQKVIENGIEYTRYKLSLPSHLQDMILQKEAKKFYINIFPQFRSAERLIFVSPSAAATSPLRARLNIRYTKVQ